MDEKLKKLNKKRSSILKKPIDFESSDFTDTKAKLVRRISFSGKKSIKEFILDEDKNTVWGTSYEEPAESNLPLNNSSSNTKGGNENPNLSVEMDIEPDLVIPIFPINLMNKENETPDNTIWPSINMGGKIPLASSTMVTDTIPLRSPIRKKDPFSWLKDPDIVGADIFQPAEVDSAESVSTGSTEDSIPFVPSPMSVSLMNRDTTCFEISSLHMEEYKRRSRMKSSGKVLQKMDISPHKDTIKSTEAEMAWKTLQFPSEQEPISLPILTTENRGKHCPQEEDEIGPTGMLEKKKFMDIIYKPEELKSRDIRMPARGVNDCDIEMSIEEESRQKMDISRVLKEVDNPKRKTIHFVEGNNQIIFTATQEVSENSSLSDARVSSMRIRKTRDNENTAAEMSLCSEDTTKSSPKTRQTVFFPPDDEGQMNVTKIPEEMSLCLQDPEKNTVKTRKTVYFPDEENQLNITEFPGQDLSLNITLCPVNAMCSEKTTSQDRQPIVLPSGRTEMDPTEVCGKRGERSAVDMSLAAEDPNKTTQDVYSPTEEDHMSVMASSTMEMNFAPQNPEKSSQKNRQSVYFGAGENQMNITEIPDQNASLRIGLCAGCVEKTAQKGRKTILFASDDNEMNLIERTMHKCTSEMRNQVNVMEICEPNAPQEMNLRSPVHQEFKQTNRKTVYFLPDEGQMNMTEVHEQKSLLQMSLTPQDIERSYQDSPKTFYNSPLEMSLCDQEAVKTVQRDRKTVHFPPDENQINVTGVSEENPTLGMSFAPQDGEKNTRKSRRTVDENQENQMNIMEIPDKKVDLPVVYDDKTLELEENPIIGGARKKTRSSVAKISPFCRRESFRNDENLSSSTIYPNEVLTTVPLDNSGRVDDTVKSLGINISEDNTMKICEALHREQRLHQSNFSLQHSKISGESCDLTKLLEDEVSRMKLLMEESYIEADSIASNRLSNDEMNSNDSIIRLVNVNPSNIRQETFTIHRHSKIPIRESAIPSPEPARCSSASLPEGNETLVLKDNQEDDEPKSRRATVAKCPEGLENFLGSDLYGKLVRNRDVVRSYLDTNEQAVALYDKNKPFMDFFLKYPSRCQLPRCPTFKELIHNMVDTSCRSIWFIDKFMDKGELMFKHRQITTFEIHMKFHRKQLKDMDSVDCRGKLTFKRINIRDTDWYTMRDPATKSKVWIYLHTKFRGQVLSDPYLLNKYYDSNTLRDFLQYIDQLCCDIYDAKPHIMEILTMYK